MVAKGWMGVGIRSQWTQEILRRDEKVLKPTYRNDCTTW